MYLHSRLARTAVFFFVPFAASLIPFHSASAYQMERNVPEVTHVASDLGSISPSKEMNITVHLNLHNKAAFDAAVEQLYNPVSPTYHKWMTDADLQKYAPTAAEVKSVKEELEKHGMTIVSVDPNRFSIRAHGTTINIEEAFQTQIHQFQMNGKTFSAHVQDARLTGEAGTLVAAVSGIERHSAKPMIMGRIDPKTGKTAAPIPLSVAKASGSGTSGIVTSTNCLAAAQAYTFTTPGAALPVASYFGNSYSAGTVPCGYTPAQLQQHYNLTQAYKQGLDGTGQTVVLIEGYGYPQMLQDANTFSSLFGLPALTSSNFKVIYPQGTVPATVQNLAGWSGEIALDIEAAHSMAPGAKIVVVATYGQDEEDFQDSIQYVTNNHLGNSVSSSWETDTEIIAGPLELNSYNQVLELGAAKGISFNFSTGDNGDEGLGTPVGAQGVPSDTPYATAVGGTSILNNPVASGHLEVGWGNFITYVALGSPLDPPLQLEQFGGAGGGESVFFAKPSWQSKLPGTGRQTPDISALADPNTGFPEIVTAGGVQEVTIIGGTSLSCPLFSGIWSIANQKAGKPLGQAARIVSTMNSSAVADIVPLSTPTNVAGTIFDSTGATYYSPSALISDGIQNATGFVTGMLSPDSTEGIILSFGTDTSLTVTKGWDNVTGYGVPIGLNFINAAAK